MQVQFIVLVMVVYVGLVGQTKARMDSAQEIFETGGLTEELSKQDMKDLLNRAAVTEVASILSRVMDKTSTTVIGGVTVDRLLAQNEISTSQCEKQTLRRRIAVCDRVRNFTNVHSYCCQCLVEAARYCLERVDSLIKEGISQDERWWQGLERAMEDYERADKPEVTNSRRTPLERYLAENR